MRIAFITDLHVLGTLAGYHMQPRYVGGERWLARQMAQRQRAEAWDLLLIGGDLVEEATAGQIREALDAWGEVACPILAALGNHDLNRPAALDLWRDLSQRWPRVTLGDVSREVQGVHLIVLNNHWLDALGTPRAYWQSGTAPVASLTDEQLAWLDTVLQLSAAPAVVCVHAPLHGVPPTQSGHAKTLEPAPPAYGTQLATVLDRHPQVRLVLSGHNHMFCASRVAGRVHLSVSALSETPHQYLLLEVVAGRITVTTRSLGPAPEGPVVDSVKQWVLGLPGDREFVLE
jgi:3',5'-cyclic AMP phosphodiesterase CpdA